MLTSFTFLSFLDSWLNNHSSTFSPPSDDWFSFVVMQRLDLHCNGQLIVNSDTIYIQLCYRICEEWVTRFHCQRDKDLCLCFRNKKLRTLQKCLQFVCSGRTNEADQGSVQAAYKNLILEMEYTSTLWVRINLKTVLWIWCLFMEARHHHKMFQFYKKFVPTLCENGGFEEFLIVCRGALILWNV